MTAITSSLIPDNFKIPLSPAQTEDVKHSVARDFIQNDSLYNSMANETETEQIRVIGRSHMPVFEHKQMPKLILKLCRTSTATEMLKYQQEAIETVKNKSLNSCVIPPSEVIVLNPASNDIDSALFIMKKIKGTPRETAKLVYQAYREFLSSPTDPATLEEKQKLRECFVQAAELICNRGYWDVSWDNILYTKKGFAFIDFEHVTPTKEHIEMGIGGLLRLAHPVFFPDILAVANRYGVDVQAIFFDRFDGAKNINEAIVEQTLFLRRSRGVQC